MFSFGGATRYVYKEVLRWETVSRVRITVCKAGFSISVSPDGVRDRSVRGDERVQTAKVSTHVSMLFRLLSKKFLADFNK